MTTETKIGIPFILFAVIIISVFLLYIVQRTVLSPTGDYKGNEIVVKIKRGASLKSIAEVLQKEGVVKNSDDFIFTAKLFKCGDKLKAGKYEFSKGLSNYKILKILIQGKTLGEKVVIPEGYTSKQIARLLQRKIGINYADFMSLVNDRNFIRKLGINENSLEGYLYPNTYNLPWGITSKDVVKILVNEFNRKFNDSLKKNAKRKGWSVHDIVTLASIIEGEAIVDSERVVISAVYHNRLRRRMLLQADPTIQYIIPDGPRRLLNKDLVIDSPYNTYKYVGLPPGPVNNPGIKSIIAAIAPANVPYLYFVARGDGGHTFSRTHKEHLRAKRKFDQYRREVRRKAYAKRRKG